MITIKKTTNFVPHSSDNFEDFDFHMIILIQQLLLL